MCDKSAEGGMFVDDFRADFRAAKLRYAEHHDCELERISTKLKERAIGANIGNAQDLDPDIAKEFFGRRAYSRHDTAHKQSPMVEIDMAYFLLTISLNTISCASYQVITRASTRRSLIARERHCRRAFVVQRGQAIRVGRFAT
jgi:hypothetical protein